MVRLHHDRALGSRLVNMIITALETEHRLPFHPLSYWLNSIIRNRIYRRGSPQPNSIRAQFIHITARNRDSSLIPPIPASLTHKIITMATQIPQIPTEQYAQIFYEKRGPIEYKKVPVPEPAEDEVLVNIKFSGVCHTDLHAWKGDWPLVSKAPLIGGHEGVGHIVKLGKLVKDLKIGDTVGIKWINGTCLSCEFCQTADEPLCQKATMSGYTVDGTFQQYAIGKAAHVSRIPEGLDLAAVAPILCAGITVYKALKESQARPGQIVAISGAGGGLGSLACQYAKAMGLRVLAIDSGEEKKTICLQDLGAEVFIDFARPPTGDIVTSIKQATPNGLGPHAVIIVAASEKPFAQAAQYVRPRGTVVCVGLPPAAKQSSDVFNMVTKMTRVCGSYVGNRADSQEAIDFFARGQIKAPFKVMGLSQLPEVFKLMEEQKIAGRIVLDTSR